MSILVCDLEEAAVIKSYREAVCWMASHPGSVLVVRDMTARLVDAHHHNDGLYFNAAKALADEREEGAQVLISRRGAHGHEDS
jgi:hypothetical protein